MIEHVKVFARREPWANGVAILVSSEDGKQVLGRSIFEKKSEYEDFEPSFRLRTTEAQSLMDSLWDCGFRPSEGSGSAGAMAATQKHLEDMRRLVFQTDGNGK